ncbi:MAG: peptidylprolyl isomerase [Proteobacteria bacterium]|nr:peptidylprolyl isomerase [Pseudomonadota bacterium]
MENKFAKASKNILIKVLVIIIIAVFALWGIGDLFSSGKNNVVAEIGNENIYTQDFNQELRNELRNQNISNIQEAIKNNFHYQVLNKLVSSKIIEIYSRENNIFVSEKTLANFIKQIPEFQTNKEFSRIKYEKYLLENGLTANTFEQNFKQSLLKKIIIDSFTGGLKSTSYHENVVHKYVTKEIGIQYLELNQIIKNINFTELEIKTYYDENKSNLLSDEYREFEFLVLDVNNLGEGNNDLFFKKISEIENNILENKNFLEIAEKYNLNNKNAFTINKSGYLINSEKSADLDQKIIEKLFNLNDNFKTDLVETKGKFYLLTLKKIIPPKSLLLNEKTKKFIINDMKLKKLSEKIKSINNEIKEAKKDLFEEIQKKENLTLKEIFFKSRFEANKLFSQSNIQQIFQKKLNENLLLETNGEFYLVKVNKENYSADTISAEKKQLYEKQVISDFSNQILFLFDKILNEKYKVKINEKVLNRIISSI